MSYAKIRPRRGTEYEWSSYNPILAEGELAIQFPDTGIGTGLCKFKVGDGITAWNQLPFAFDGTAAAAIDGGGINASALIQIRTATANAWYNTNPILVEREIAYCSDPEINSIKIGDGVTRWNSLPYIKASSLIESTDNYDFGTEDSDEEVPTVTEMENYVNYNSNYAADVFDNYNGVKPDIPETPDEPENPDEPTPNPDTPEDPENPSEDDNQEQPVETAGLRDLLKSAPTEEENTEEEVVEEPKTTTRSRKSKK